MNGRKFVIVKNRTSIQPIPRGTKFISISSSVVNVQGWIGEFRKQQPLADWDIYELVSPFKNEQKT